MVATATLLEAKAGWPAGTKHYAISDGRYFAVRVDEGVPGAEYINEALQLVGGGAQFIVREPTVIVECNDEGIALTLERLHTFPPGTTHEDALIQAGYEIGE